MPEPQPGERGTATKTGRSARGSDERQELASGRDLVREGILASGELRLPGLRQRADARELREERLETVEERAAVLVARGREHREAAFADARHGVHLAHVPAQRLRELLLGRFG